MSLNKIYSRPRIRIFKPRSKKDKLKFLFFVIWIILIILLVIIIKAAYPVFKSSCETKASSIAVTVLNNKVNEAVTNYNYDDLVNIVKNDNGDISYIEANVISINQLVSEITENIQSELDNLTNITIELNFGSISGISCLSLISPKFSVKMESARKYWSKHKIRI